MKNAAQPFFQDLFYQGDGDFTSERSKLNWVEESFVFEKESGKQIASIQSNEYIGSSLRQKRVWFFFGIVGLFYVILITKVTMLQIMNGAFYATKAEGNRERIIPIESERGLIYDRNGIELTKNVPSFSLAIIPQELPRDPTEREKIVQKIATITNQDVQVIRDTLKEYGSYSYESIVIQDDIDYEAALMLQIQAADLPGISIKRGSKRLYIQGDSHNNTITSSTLSLSHVLGYEGKLSRKELDQLYPKGYLPSDTLGKTGIEKQYETELRGSYGKQRIEVNAFGKEQSNIAEEAPEPGKHLTLSIDSKMQQQLELIMKSAMDKAGKKRGAGVVMNPNNGEILALVSLPAFDNNDFSGGISQDKYSFYTQNPDSPLFNRVFGGNYPSGSTIKPVMAAAALQEGIITPSTSFLSTGGLKVGPWFFPDWQAGGHGITNVRKSLAQSVNTFYYYIGGGYDKFQGLGVDKIDEYLKKFLFSTPLGIDIPGELGGFVPTRDWKERQGGKWYVGDTYNLSIGQGDLLVTPLQIAEMTSFFANWGTMYKPHVVKAITDPVTKQKQEISPVVLAKNMVSQSTIETVRLGMKDCATDGSCRRLSLLPFSAAGKTGTAQWNANKPNHAWFTSFAPFENPEIVVTILVEEGEEGSRISAPIAYEFYKWWGTYKK